MITSRNNPEIVEVSKLKQRKHRRRRGKYLIEGKKLLSEAINSNLALEKVYITEKLLNEVDLGDIPFETVSEPVLEKLSSQVSPEGVVAIVEIEENDILLTNSVYLDQISDPGNLGTILRTADAAGYEQAILSENCVDLYNEKVLRASMGSIFHLNIVTGGDASYLEAFKDEGFKVIGADVNGEEIDIKKVVIPEEYVLVLGSESHGLSEDVLDILDERVKIPVYGEAESLNVSVAAGILMYAYQTNL